MIKDQSIRQQILEDHCNQIVYAGAGTGKTTLIVQKYIQLIHNGMDPQKIVAITFTQKSADELKTRIGKAYQEKFPDRPKLLIHQLPISTIHGFCKRLIDPFSYEFGLLPQYQIEQDFIYERYEKALEENLPQLIIQNEDLLLVKLLGWIRVSSISDWMMDLLPIHSLPVTSKPNAFSFPMNNIQNLLSEASRHLADCSNEEDILYQSIIHWNNILQALELTNPLSWISLLEQKIEKFSRKGNQSNWGSKKDLQEVRHTMEQVMLLVENFQSSLSQHLIDEVLYIQSQMKYQLTKLKKNEQWIEPDDLLSFALTLLKQERFWERLSSFQYIFLDEFQDTDPIQTEIVWRLFSKNFPDPKLSWDQIEIKQACMTIVGDKQQSIYRFRQASVEIFSKVKSLIEAANGCSYIISQNFRSTPEILNFVNQQFSTLESFFPLQAKESSQESKVIIAESDQDTEKLKMEELRELEAVSLQQPLEKLLQVYPDVKPSDCVVLTPSFSNVDVLERAFQSSFDVVKQRKSEHLHPWFASILNVLAYFEAPQDPQRLWSLLRTPMFFQDLQFFESHQKKEGGLTLINLEDVEIKDRILFYQELYNQSLFLFFKTFYQDCMAVFGKEKGVYQTEIQVLAWTLDQVIVYETNLTKEKTVTQYLQDQFKVAFMPNHPQALPIMTMHQSKGLEFEVVLLSGLYNQVGKSQHFYTSPLTRKTAMALTPFSNWLKTKDFEGVKDAENQAFVLEKQRLLYVAATRAKRFLITTKFATQTRQKTYADLLWQGS